MYRNHRLSGLKTFMYSISIIAASFLLKASYLVHFLASSACSANSRESRYQKAAREPRNLIGRGISYV